MLRQGFAVDSSDYDGRTALMLAAAKGHADVVNSLLAAGCDPQVSLHASADSHFSSRQLPCWPPAATISQPACPGQLVRRHHLLVQRQRAAQCAQAFPQLHAPPLMP